MDTNRTNMKNKMTSHALALVAAALLSTSVSVGAADAKLDGIISLCGFVPKGCQDDCFRGIKIKSFEWHE